MPIWLYIPLLLLVFWFFIGLILYGGKIWSGMFPLGKKDVRTIIFLKLLPVVWSVSCLSLGIIYLSLTKEQDQNAVIALLLIPAALLVVLGAVYVYHSNKWRKEEFNNETMVEIKKERCLQWVRKFPFINGNFDIQIYISNNKAVGRITVYDVTNEQIRELEQEQSELPEGIYLCIVPINKH